MSKTILIVGGGGREYSLAQKIMQSSHVSHLFIAPGNGGTAQMPGVHNVPIAAKDVDALVQFAQHKQIDLTIVGPEEALAHGIVDLFTHAGLPCLGPSQAAARLETSKAFAKQFMTRHGIPTAPFMSTSSLAEAHDYLKTQLYPLVIKADGLTRGKGVFVVHDNARACAVAETLLSGTAFGEAGKTIVIEQFLSGKEISFFVLSDGKTGIPFASAQDYKDRDNGNTGVLTGGMGACSPAPTLTPTLHEQIMDTIITPTLHHMMQEGNPYTGFLYAGLMITPDGKPHVLEFNARLGDPEAQAVLSRLQSDFIEVAEATLHQTLHDFTIAWDPRKAVTVVLADSGYPSLPLHKGQPIRLPEQLPAESQLFHAGTKWEENQLVSSSGRILSVTTLGTTFQEARDKAYGIVERIEIPHLHYRTDIGDLPI